MRPGIRYLDSCWVLIWATMPFLVGCSASMIRVNPPSDTDTATVQVTVVRADTQEALGVEAAIVVGGESATLPAGETVVRVSGVPFGTSDPPTQPLTVNAAGFVTYFDDLELNPTGVTQVRVEMEQYDPEMMGTVAGTVTNLESGNPIANVVVEFKPDISGTPQSLKTATDRTGRYTARGVLTGATVARATASGFLTAERKLVVVQDSTGENEALDFALVPTTSKANVRGLVIDLISREPIENASVTIGGVGPAVTDRRGRFELLEVPVGEQLVEVTADGYDPFSETTTILPVMPDLQIQLAPSQAKPPPGPATIRGTVTIRNNPDNSGAVVRALSEETGQVIDTAVTNEAGEYGLWVPPGRYRIEVTFKSVVISKTVALGGAGRTLEGVDFQITAP